MSFRHISTNSSESLTVPDRKYKKLINPNLILIQKKKTISNTLPSLLILRPNKDNALYKSTDTSTTQSSVKTIKKVKKTVTFGNIDIIDYSPEAILRPMRVAKTEKVKCQCIIF